MQFIKVVYEKLATNMIIANFLCNNCVQWYGIVGFNVPLVTRHIIGHFGDDFTGQITQPTV